MENKVTPLEIVIMVVGYIGLMVGCGLLSGDKYMTILVFVGVPVGLLILGYGVNWCLHRVLEWMETTMEQKYEDLLNR